MSQFDESKLSRILARRIIAPEDRSQFLPMCTPIYCPDNNGVKASQVTIIDPNLNTFFDDVDPTNTRSKYIGSQINSKGVGGLQISSNVSTIGSINIDGNGVVSGFSKDNYIQIPSLNVGDVLVLCLSSFSNSDTRFMRILTAGSTQIVEFHDGKYYCSGDRSGEVTTYSNNYIKITVLTSNQYRIQIGFSKDDLSFVNLTKSGNIVGVPLSIGSYSTLASDNTPFNGTIDLTSSYLNNDPLASIVDLKPQATRQPNEVQNIINIDLNKSVSRDYFVPYEVELKSDADIMSVIKSDFAAYFKNRVSNEIVDQLVLLHTTNAISTINKGASLAETFGEVISTFVSQGTGQKYSIYKYNNGAPVVYSTSSNQPNIDKNINQNNDMLYATKDDIDVPALYFLEQPTLILPNTTYTDYQTELCNGNIKTYTKDMINVETATADFSQLGEGVFGTNDTFAVAFSAPSIKLVPDTNFYGYRLCCTMLYGVKLVHKHNLRLIV